MTIRSTTTLKTYFETNDRPTQTEFADLIDSFVHSEDWDKLPIRRYSARKAGILTSNSGAANTAALQALIDTLTVSNLISLIVFEDGTFPFAAQGSAATRPGSSNQSKACIWLKSYIFLEGQGEGTILKRADAQQTDAVRVHLIQCGTGISNIGLRKIRLNNNVANQSGFTGGYDGGDTNGCLIAFGGNTGGPTNVTFENLWLEDNFGAACDIVLPTRVLGRDITVRESGEGFQVNGPSDFCSVNGFTYRNDTEVSVGDGIELVNGVGEAFIRLTNFDIRGTDAGSSIDVTGRNIHVTNGNIIGGTYGLVVQCDAANGTFPNSDNFLISGVTAKETTGIAFSASGERNGSFRGVFSNCHALDCERGFIVGQQTQRAEGVVSILGCSSIGHSVAGLQITTVNKVRVSGGCQFNDGGASAYGIWLHNTGANDAGQQVVEIDETTCNNNGRFGVYQDEDNKWGAKGYVRVSAQGNMTSGETYFGNEYVQSEMYLDLRPVTDITDANPTTQTTLRSNETANRLLFEVANTATRWKKTTLTRSDLGVTGERQFFWSHSTLKQLKGMTHNSIIDLIFDATVNVEHLGASGGNVSLKTEEDEEFAENDTIRLRWDNVNSLAKEISRTQTVVPPFTPQGVADFEAWYKRGDGLWQNTGKTTAATADTHNVRVWSPAYGSYPDFVAASDGLTRNAIGGVLGASGKFLSLASTVDLSGPYTIILRHQLPAAYNTGDRFFSLSSSGNNWQIAASPQTCGFYDNADAAFIQLNAAGDYDPLVLYATVAICVSASGATTLYKIDGTSVSGDGSSGSTFRSATSQLRLLTDPTESTFCALAVSDLLIYSRELTSDEISDIKAIIDA